MGFMLDRREPRETWGFGFGVRDEENNYRFQLTNSTCIRVKTLPLLLTEYGKFTGLVNEPLSYPLTYHGS